MPSSGAFLRQLSGKEAWKSTSWRWGGNTKYNNNVGGTGYSGGFEMEGLNMYGNGVENGLVLRKRVMVVVDQSSHSKHAMMWALTHVTNKGDLLTLLHVISPTQDGSDSSSTYLANSLGSLCKACKPEVEVEALVIQGPKLATVMSQVKKLEVSVLVLGQKRPSAFLNCLCLFGTSSSSEEFVEQCINNADCLTIGVRKQSKGVGGYLISTRWQKNFWLLA
ncbi:UspA [Corchorus capsularis]|uniref:UspA n=1 Tax=Corchorus capsularis TaxID=210143 RepID=A0A1R3J9S0_COCAP|nr:UspA [Corchorus capsularis]